MASITNCKVFINCYNDHNRAICKAYCSNVNATCFDCSCLSGAFCEKCETNYSIKGNDEVTLQIDSTKLSNTTLNINEINYDDNNKSLFYSCNYYDFASFNSLILS